MINARETCKVFQRIHLLPHPVPRPVTFNSRDYNPRSFVNITHKAKLTDNFTDDMFTIVRGLQYVFMHNNIIPLLTQRNVRTCNAIEVCTNVITLRLISNTEIPLVVLTQNYPTIIYSDRNVDYSPMEFLACLIDLRLHRFPAAFIPLRCTAMYLNVCMSKNTFIIL